MPEAAHPWYIGSEVYDLGIAASILNGIVRKGTMAHKSRDTWANYRLDILGMTLFLTQQDSYDSRYAQLDLSRIDAETGQVWFCVLLCDKAVVGVLNFLEFRNKPNQSRTVAVPQKWIGRSNLVGTASINGADELKRDLLLLHMIFGDGDAQ